jgi:hypothetical protein
LCGPAGISPYLAPFHIGAASRELGKIKNILLRTLAADEDVIQMDKI